MLKSFLFWKLSFVVLFLWCSSYSQDLTPNKYGLSVVDKPETYQNLVEKDSNNLLVDIEKYIPGIKLDIKYANKDNFMQKVLYPEAKAYARLPVAKALVKIQNELKKKGLELKIFDIYRPYSITLLMWDEIKDDRYVADPKKGSRHNRGCAVDLTIIESATGNELEMPTPFDDFTNKAHHSYKNLTKKVLNNRSLLRNIMEKHGFQIITSEWWHYDLKGYSKYHLMDISFNQLNKLNKP